MTRTQAIVKRHWILDVLDYFDLTSAEIPNGASVSDAWSAAETATGLTAEELSKKVAAFFRLGVADLSSADLRILKLIPEKLARRHRVFPLWQDDRFLYIAASEPSKLEAEQAIGFASGRNPVFRIASPKAIQEAIDRCYSPDKVIDGLLAEVNGDMENAVRVVGEYEPESVGLGEIEAGPVVRLTNLILTEAVNQKASDIHIEPAQGGGLVRFRVDGVLRNQMQLPRGAITRVVSRLKVLGKLDIADRLRPQDGRARVQIDQKMYDLRMSTVPTRDSEKAVIRILDPGAAKSIDDLALPPAEVRRFRTLLSNREGIVLVTGPTGSGKTTTLYAALRELANGKVNITTVEDPVEYQLSGMTQIQAEPKRGVTFASALRAILRQDPDVIFVGEIRDLETATMAVQAAMTGHLVLSTLHTNDATGAIARLLDLGLDRASIAATLRGVVAQRLIRKVCSECGETIHSELTIEERRLSTIYGLTPGVRAKGCEKCRQSGYLGRTPIQEILVINSQLQEAISSGTPISGLQKMALGAGMRSLRSAGIACAAEGVTTLQELDRVLGDSGEASLPVTTSEQPHVLIADDDPINRRLERSHLEKQGFKVSEAADGMSALEMVSTGGAYSLIILDLSMPAVSGREVLAKLKKSASTAGIPIVVLTGSEDDFTEAQLMEEGADDYIRKPLDPTKFIARIKAVLRRSNS